MKLTTDTASQPLSLQLASQSCCWRQLGATERYKWDTGDAVSFQLICCSHGEWTLVSIKAKLNLLDYDGFFLLGVIGLVTRKLIYKIDREEESI